MESDEGREKLRAEVDPTELVEFDEIAKQMKAVREIIKKLDKELYDGYGVVGLETEGKA